MQPQSKCADPDPPTLAPAADSCIKINFFELRKRINIVSIHKKSFSNHYFYIKFLQVCGKEPERGEPQLVISAPSQGGNSISAPAQGDNLISAPRLSFRLYNSDKQAMLLSSVSIEA